MAKKMLIDAAHPEETRVVVLDGQRVDDFDFETQNKKQLRGNIYLAKVTRVEPSLQAAFVEYGGNRHGFLAFGEIHPDYYQIPVADREALKAEVDAAAAEEVAEGEEEDEGAEDERRRRVLTRRYKIQEVIRRRQIMLVQVVKEERGNKGAALTTYLSLAGRYCVLMPNSGRGGGISRKITNSTDRKRLKKIATDLEVPHGMGLIVRTAGAKRTKTEIKRDYEYLTRAWETIRDQTLRSVAPALIYEESSLVKRAIRDLYDKDVDDIHVEGDAAYKEAKDFVRMLMPSHAKRVHHWREPTPIFTKSGVEKQLENIYSPVVNLKSGGYIVINQTEALVAIDVNSGRATRERGIEQTALKTNLEAADEAARQMRMRDLAGLIVIDFIDMEEPKNDRAVEKRVKDALRFDRARIQTGKISSFGLMELSRQRRRTGILEGSSHVCAHCGGSGRVRSIESSALHLIRALDDEAVKNRAEVIEARAPTDVALYVLNEKRDALARIEQSRGLRIRVIGVSTLSPPDFELTSHGERREAPAQLEAPRTPDIEDAEDEALDLAAEQAEAEDIAAEAGERRAPRARQSDGEGDGEREPRPERAEGQSSEGGRRRRRRGRRGGRRREEGDAPPAGEDAIAASEDTEENTEAGEALEAKPEGEQQSGERTGRRRRRRRRGRRGGEGSSIGASENESESAGEDEGENDEGAETPIYSAPEPEPAPKPRQFAPEAESAPEAEPEPVAPAAAAAVEDQPAPAPAAPAPEEPPAPVALEEDYAPDRERREKFFARMSRWGKKEAG